MFKVWSELCFEWALKKFELSNQLFLWWLSCICAYRGSDVVPGFESPAEFWRDTKGIGLCYFGGDLPFLIMMWGCLGLVYQRFEDNPVGGLRNFLMVIVEVFFFF